MTLGVGVREPAVLILLILLASAAGATGAPSYAAMQPDLVPPEELMAMVSLGVYSWNSGRIIGPLLGTALVLLVGPAWTIGFNAGSFVVLAVAVALVRRSFRPTHSDGTIFDRLVGGWRTLRSTTGLLPRRRSVGPVQPHHRSVHRSHSHLPTRRLRRRHGMAGTVASAQGAGAIIGGVTLSILAHRHPRSLLIGRLIVMLALSLGLYAVAPNAAWVVVASALLGGAGAGFFIASSAIIQRDAPAASRGRVMSIMQAAMGISYGVGLLFIGVDRRRHQLAPRVRRRGDTDAGRFRRADPAVAPLAYSSRRRASTRRRNGLTLSSLRRPTPRQPRPRPTKQHRR